MMALAGSSSSDTTAMIFFAVLGIIIVFGLIKSWDPGRKDMLRRVAGRVGGTFVDGGWLSESRVQFRIAGRDAVLTFFAGSKNSSPNSRVTVSLENPGKAALHILEDGFGRSFLKIFGAQDLSIGDADFDRDYVVKASPDSYAARIFARERRADVIRTVRSLKGLADPTFEVRPGSLTVTVRRYLRDEEQIFTVITAAREFADYVLKDPAPPGVVLGELTAAGGACPVCGTPLRDRVVRCGTCATAHHGECWTYAGRCATYACRGTRAR